MRNRVVLNKDRDYSSAPNERRDGSSNSDSTEYDTPGESTPDPSNSEDYSADSPAPVSGTTVLPRSASSPNLTPPASGSANPLTKGADGVGDDSEDGNKAGNGQ